MIEKTLTLTLLSFGKVCFYLTVLASDDAVAAASCSSPFMWLPAAMTFKHPRCKMQQERTAARSRQLLKNIRDKHTPFGIPISG
jgi:hypothetical protein